MYKKFGDDHLWARYENTLLCLESITGVTLYLLSRTGALLGTISDNPDAAELFLASQMRLRRIIDSATAEFPSFLSEEHGTSFFSIKTVCGILLCGPVLHVRIKEESYYDQFEESTLSVTEKIRYVESLKFTPVLDYRRFVELGLVISNLMNKSDISVDNLVLKRRLFYFGEQKEPFIYNRERFRHPDLSLDVRGKLIEALRSADKGKLTGVLHEIRNWNFNFVGSSQIRGYRLTFAVFAGVIMNECIEAGLDGELSMRLCEYYIDWFDRSKTIDEIIGVFVKMLFDYTDRLGQVKKSRISRLSAEFEKYVQNRLSDRITLEDAATALRITPQYLCKKIRADFGVTPNQLIHKIKTEEAKRLLAAREMPLSELWLYLGYCDQSHFNKVFKEYAGTTPGDYALAVG